MKIVVFDLDETLGYFTQYPGGGETLASFYPPQVGGRNAGFRGKFL